MPTTTVRAKFTVNTIELYSSPEDSGRVKLHATNTKEGDNVDWSKWTPSGQIEMTITNPAAFTVFKDAFSKKQAFYVDFNVVE